MIKSSNSQGEHFRSISTLTPHLWNHLTSSIVNPRAHFNLPLVLPAPTPLSMPSFSTLRPPQSAFDYLVHRPTSIERSMLLPMPESIEIQRPNSPNDQTRQIRFYNDRVDFRGDVIFKPVRAKSKTIFFLTLKFSFFVFRLSNSLGISLHSSRRSSIRIDNSMGKSK